MYLNPRIANFNINKFVRLAKKTLPEWEVGSMLRSKIPMDKWDDNADLITETTASLEALKKRISAQKWRTIRDDSPERNIVGGVVYLDHPDGNRYISSIVSNPDFDTKGQGLRHAARRLKRGGRPVIADSVLSEVPYRKAGWIPLDDGGWQAP